MPSFSPAFQAPAAPRIGATMFAEGDVGVTPPLGVWDPLGLISKRDMRRYEIMEIKHGRAAMLGFIHCILIEAGARFPGYISPTAGWLQIMLVTCMAETGAGNVQEFSTQGGLFGSPQTVDKAPGDIGGDVWQRYDDPEEE